MRKTIIITGANGGIGKALVKQLLEAGNTVIMIARESEKTHSAYDEMNPPDGEGRLQLLTGDLSVPADIQTIIGAVAGPVDVLINNAGLLKQKKELSAEGIEMTMSVNYLAAYRLTMGLIRENKMPKRIINITSELFKKGKLNVSEMIDPPRYKGQQIYANSKQANLLLSSMLNKTYAAGTDVIAMHPGVVATGVFRDYPHWFATLLNCFLEKPDAAAKKIAEVALADTVKPGYYNQNQYKGGFSEFADEGTAAELFAFSEQYL